MTAEEKKYIGHWLEKAEHDLIAARLLIESVPLILDISCFHCQQASEKFLKAFLAFHSVDLEKTHDIILLQRKCSAIDFDFSELDFRNLSHFAVKARYPFYPDTPSLEEAKFFLSAATKVKELVLKKVKLD